MNQYFLHFKLGPAFLLDESQLRKEYLHLQKLWHPDFYASNAEEMENALKYTAFNNEAYKALQSFESRILAVLTDYGMWKEGEKHQLPQSFLMDMLDLHDLIQEASTDENSKNDVASQLKSLRDETQMELKRLAEIADKQSENWNPSILEPIRTEYEKLRYIHRLQKNLDGSPEL